MYLDETDRNLKYRHIHMHVGAGETRQGPIFCPINLCLIHFDK